MVHSRQRVRVGGCGVFERINRAGFLMRRWKTGLLVAVALLTPPVWASDYEFDGPVRKLGRGAANITFGVWEIPIRMQEVYGIDGWVAASTFGVVSGLLGAIQRVSLGVFEVVTFPFPQPNGTYQPLVTPEFIPSR